MQPIHNSESKGYLTVKEYPAHPLLINTKTDTYALKDAVIYLHSPGHGRINGVPDGLQSFDSDVVWYHPGVRQGSDPPLVCGDENRVKHIVVLGSRRKWGKLFASLFASGRRGV